MNRHKCFPHKSVDKCPMVKLNNRKYKQYTGMVSNLSLFHDIAKSPLVKDHMAEKIALVSGFVNTLNDLAMVCGDCPILSYDLEET